MLIIRNQRNQSLTILIYAQLVALVSTTFVWRNVLQDIFPITTSGYDCIIATSSNAFTFGIDEGVPRYRYGNHMYPMSDYLHTHFSSGKGYLYQDKYRNKNITERLNDEITISIFPTDAYFGAEKTQTPAQASVGSVCIILLTTLLFFGYDFLVRKEFQSKRELLEAKRHFVRYVSHEVRTPLNSVCVGLTLIQEEIAGVLGFRSGDEMKRSFSEPTTTNESKDKSNINARHWFVLVQEVLDSAEVSVNVLNDMLNYDKIERGELVLELTVVKIWNLVQSTVDEFRMAAAKKDLTFSFCFVCPDGTEVALATDLPKDMRRQGAVGDEMRLRQVLRNLLSNAIKFTPEHGTVTVRAATTAQSNTAPAAKSKRTYVIKTGDEITVRLGDYLQIQVQDSGAGMTPSQLAELYTEGRQFNKNKLQGGGGSGLGLFITHGIVKQHEGALVATSEGLGKGCTFAMTLPLYRSARILKLNQDDHHTNLNVEVAPSSTTSRPALSSSVAEADRCFLRLLVVDDVLMSRKLLARLLQHHGHHCDLACDGQQAVDMTTQAIAEGNPYHSILLDYEMPVMNGPDAAKEMRRRKLDPCFIIGVTGNMLPDDVQYFLECGANEVLPKPFQYARIEELWNKNRVYDSVV